MKPTFSQASPKKVVLAIDPLNFNQRVLTRVEQGLAELFGADIPAVSSVFVLTPEAALTPFSWFDHVASSLQHDYYQSIVQTLSNANIAIEDPKVIVQKRGSPEGIAVQINAFAKAESASLIVVPTQGKGFIQRLFLGSVSNSLLQQTTLPLLILAPGVEPLLASRLSKAKHLESSKSRRLRRNHDHLIMRGTTPRTANAENIHPAYRLLRIEKL